MFMNQQKLISSRKLIQHLCTWRPFLNAASVCCFWLLHQSVSVLNHSMISNFFLKTFFRQCLRNEENQEAHASSTNSDLTSLSNALEKNTPGNNSSRLARGKYSCMMA